MVLSIGKLHRESPSSFLPLTPCAYLIHGGEWRQEGATGMKNLQKHIVLKGDVREGPVHEDHLCVLNVLP